MTKVDPRSALVRDVVRGQRNWRELRDHGVGIDVTPDSVREFGGLEKPVKVSAIDIAQGWLQHSANERALREWARFVHGAVGLVEPDVETHPLGDELLDILWRVSFNEPVTGDMEKTVRRIVIST